jgi:hypothetical protein
VEKGHHTDTKERIIDGMDRSTGELRDLAAAVTGIARCHRLTPGIVVVGLIELPDTIQHLLDTAILSAGRRVPAEARDCAGLIRSTAQRLFGPRLTLGQPRHLFLTVVVRNGPLELTAADRAWIDGWQQADHGVPAYGGRVVLLTDRGWRSAHDNRGGYHPALAA